VWEQRHKVFDGWVLTELRGASVCVLDCCEGDVVAEHGVLIPGRVVDVQQADVAADPHAKADSLVAVGSPASAEVMLDTGNRSVGSGEGNRPRPFKYWLAVGVVQPEPVPVVDRIIRVDVSRFGASQRNKLIEYAPGMVRN
jgi:hypothetical protein